MGEALRVGVIGSGGNARHHMKTLLDIKDVEIVGICDPDDEALGIATGMHPSMAKVPTFHDFREMLDAVVMDAAVISTPHVFHFEQIMECLDRGLHVLCEKPMVCTTEQARAVVDKVRSTGLVMGISYQRHFMGPYRYCRQRIQSGELGGLTFISALQSQNWYAHMLPHKAWRVQKDLSCGGQLNDSGSHLIDIILWMTNAEPVRVFAFENNLEAEVDILTAMSVEFQGGALCNVSVVGHSVNWLEDITIWCEKGTLAIRGDEVHEWVGGEQRVVHKGADLPGLGTADANFIAAIRGQAEIQAPPECGLKVIRLTEAVWKSAELGQPVEVPPL
ncbi:MAG: Gfo/Idh/MocA family oxidoreductase, partial [Armatimonadetes bacterium]|nr:Gfo/Idh/MocA family oxidoreductase [Armatimonadota bacterium]